MLASMKSLSYSLVEKDFAVIFAIYSSFSETSYTAAVRLRALEEAAIAAYRIADSILGCAVEFCSPNQQTRHDHLLKSTNLLKQK
jgi:hypothetical protein